MNTLRYLGDPALAGLFWPGILVGLGVGVMGSVLSVLVVLKRLSFIGQGISHAALGGVGVAVILGMGASSLSALGVIVAFCLGGAWLVAALTRRRTLSADTAIGIVLVVSMALGAILLVEAVRRGGPGRAGSPAWESILFGSINGVGWGDAALAWGVCAAVLGTLGWFRRPLLFWAFDEAAAPAFGVPSRAMRLLLLLLLTLAIVASMRLAGVILATALLVLPGAAALHLSDRWGFVMACSVGVGLTGVGGGLVVSFERDWPPGPSMVGVLVFLYGVARVAGSVRRATLRE